MKIEVTLSAGEMVQQAATDFAADPKTHKGAIRNSRKALKT
jgi:hypothetical protein